MSPGAHCADKTVPCSTVGSIWTGWLYFDTTVPVFEYHTYITVNPRSIQCAVVVTRVCLACMYKQSMSMPRDYSRSKKHHTPFEFICLWNGYSKHNPEPTPHKLRIFSVQHANKSSPSAQATVTWWSGKLGFRTGTPQWCLLIGPRRRGGVKLGRQFPRGNGDGSWLYQWIAFLLWRYSNIIYVITTMMAPIVKWR